jgi:hypothetical protein
MRRAIVALGACIAAAGCQTMPASPVEVRVPVPVPCVDAAELPKRPPIAADRDLAALPDAAFVGALWRERSALAAYALRAEAVLGACVRASS